MKKLPLFILVIALLISLSVYALTSPKTNDDTFENHVISGEAKNVRDARIEIARWLQFSKEYRISAISITALPCGRPGDPCGVAYIASFEKRTP